MLESDKPYLVVQIVPNVKSMTEEALAALGKAMLKGVVKYKYSSSTVEGSVIGKVFSRKHDKSTKTVTIFVSLGMKQDVATASFCVGSGVASGVALVLYFQPRNYNLSGMVILI